MGKTSFTTNLPVHLASNCSTSPSSEEDTSTTVTLDNPVETTVTSSGIHSMWLNWKNPRAVMDLCTESETGSALEIRRQKNRESMRRSRQRQRDQLQMLRDAVTDLEKQYQSIRLRSEPFKNDQNITSTSDRKYVQAVELSKQLGAENLYLKASIQYQASWKLELRRVMETTVALDEFTASVSKPPSPFPFKLKMMNEQEAESVFGFHPFTERDVKDVILQNTKSVKRVQHQLLSSNNRKLSGDKYDIRADEEVTDEVFGSIDQSELFGWDLRRRVRGSDMEFVFTKRFKKLSVLEIMQKSWVNGMHLKGAQMVKYDIQRLEMLQEVNTNAYVLGRDVRSPDESPVFRTTLLRYRMEMTGTVPLNGSLLADEEIKTNSNLRATGFVIGTQSLNPADTSGAKLLPERAGIEPSAPLVWAELAYSIEIVQVSDRITGEDKYVQVRWSGKNNYGSTFDAHRNAADMVTTLLRWEFGTIAPAIQLIPSLEDAKPKSNQ
ncbi:hypothetical protein KXD40_009347 [Peronospora effusa]|uniref:BZIP domain-containing protein n=1 Tax=Peronospora effusa TaxID=542832 RepID=A0A3M6VRJ4_9STRA|nr:hypothetical protein DD238_007668 [Peronospora effusa]RQM18797.1 hypothetical protein DD237_007997 [Peronospora effusa]UIZ28593.1 hypothetical protein KXD40_009347 [Peronospora effusa]CAI5729835.1 unnamed protein product [Peronospora effusa]